MPNTIATTEVTDNSSTGRTFFLFRWGAGIAGWMYHGVASVITGFWMLSEVIRNIFGSRRRRDSNNSGSTRSFLNNEAGTVVNETTEELDIARESCVSVQDFLVAKLLAQHNKSHPDISSTSPYVSISLDQDPLNFLLEHENQAASFILHLASFPNINYIDFTEVDFSAFKNADYNKLQKFLMDILESNPFITRIKFPESINYDKFTRFDLITQKMSQHRAFYVANYRRYESSPEQEEIKNFYLIKAPEIIATREAKISELYTRLDSSASASSVSHLFPAKQIRDIFNRFKENIISFLRRNQAEVSSIDKTNESFKLCASVEELKRKTVEISDSIRQNSVNATREPRAAHIVNSSESEASDDSSSSALIVIPTAASTENTTKKQFFMSRFFGNNAQNSASLVTSLSDDDEGDEDPYVFITKKRDGTENLAQRIERFEQMTTEVQRINALWAEFKRLEKSGASSSQTNKLLFKLQYTGLLDVTEGREYDLMEALNDTIVRQKKGFCHIGKFNQMQSLTDNYYSDSKVEASYKEAYELLNSNPTLDTWIIEAKEPINLELEKNTAFWIEKRQHFLLSCTITKQQDGIETRLDAVKIKQEKLMMSALKQAAVIDKIKAARASKKSQARVSTSSESSLSSGLSNGSSHSSKESLCSGNAEEIIITGVVVPDENPKMSDATSAIDTTKVPRGQGSPCFYTEAADALSKTIGGPIVDAGTVHVVDGCFNN